LEEKKRKRGIMERWNNVPKIFLLRRNRFSRILEKLKKIEDFLFFGRRLERFNTLLYSCRLLTVDCRLI
jgi:hypothetical protein